jgi:hypothetical protein
MLGRHVLDNLMPARRLRVSPGHTYNATITIDILTTRWWAASP